MISVISEGKETKKKKKEKNKLNGKMEG